MEFLLTVFSYMKNIPLELDDLLTNNQEFLNLSFGYFFHFEWNNLYQIAFESILRYIISNCKSFPKTIRHVMFYNENRCLKI